MPAFDSGKATGAHMVSAGSLHSGGVAFVLAGRLRAVVRRLIHSGTAHYAHG